MEQQKENTQQEAEQNRKKPSTAMKITVLVILVALLAAGILLPIKLVPNALSSISSSISSLFVGKDIAVLTTDRKTINSGEQFTLSWTGKHKTDGTYSLSYACSTGLQLQTSINQPNETIACGSNYYFSPNDNNIDLTAQSVSERYSDIVLSLGFLQNGASTVDSLGTTTITITNPNLTEAIPATTTPSVSVEPSTPATTTPAVPSQPVVTPTPTPSKPVTTPAPSHPVSNPNGLADLEVRAVATGYLSNTGVFVPSANINATQQAAVKFQIVNVGDKNTGSWNFSATIPSDTDPQYFSGTQQNLGPGDRIEYVLGFMNLKSTSNNIITITADPSNLLGERSKTNNTARMNIVNSQYISANGQPDLVLHMLDTGIVNRSNGSYSPSTTAGSGDRVAVRFQVQNVGAVATGAWKFQAILPTSDASISTYNSDTEPSLNPGQSQTFTIAFETLKYQGANTITVTVDSQNQVNEANENNTASININRN